MTLADQADGCVSSSTTLLDSKVTPKTDGDRSALLLGSVAHSNRARETERAARWTFGATQRGIMTLADQADGCVSSPTTLLDSHDRWGPVCASPGIGNSLKRRLSLRPVS